MDLKAYLDKTGESAASFAKRAKVPRSTINEVRAGYSTSALYALKIIQASGGLIALDDIAKGARRTGWNTAARG